MPYVIKKSTEKGETGYKVCKRDEPSRCFSKHPLSEEKAKRQRTAIIMSEMGMSLRSGTSARARRGGNGSEEEQEAVPMPKTIQGLKEYLNANGYEGEVHELAFRTPKPKKADWVALYERARANPRENTAVGTLARDAEEAFRQLGISRRSGRSPS